MKDSIYIVYDRDGIQKKVKTMKGVVQGPGLFVQKVTLSVPDEVFDREIPEATIEIPAGQAQPIEAEVSYDREDICSTVPVEVDSTAPDIGEEFRELEAWRTLYRCPDCGFQKVCQQGEPFGVHFEPEDREGEE